MNKKIYRFIRAFIVISSLSLAILLLILTFTIGPEVIQNNRRVWMIGKAVDVSVLRPKVNPFLYFTVNLENKKMINVIYDFTDPQKVCRNNNAKNVGTTIQNGDIVEVLGYAIDLGKSITVCDNKRAYIK